MQQYPAYSCSGFDHVLAIVEHYHQLPPRQCIRHTLGRHGTGPELEPERRGNGNRDKLGIGQRSEFGDSGPICKLREKLPRDFDAEACLADSSLTDQGDKAMRSHQLRHLGQLGLSADQLGNRLQKTDDGAAAGFRRDQLGVARAAGIGPVGHSGKAQPFENALDLVLVDLAGDLKGDRRPLLDEATDGHSRFQRHVFGQMQLGALDIAC